MLVGRGVDEVFLNLLDFAGKFLDRMSRIDEKIYTLFDRGEPRIDIFNPRL